MDSATQKTQAHVNLLNNLIELDFDAIEAYEAAITRLSNPHDQDSLRGFMSDHQRHTQDLADVVRELGEKPKTGTDFKHVLTKGKVVLAGLMGDTAILWAMRSNEDDTNKAYEKATEEPGLPARIRDILERNLNDERRHRAWLVQRLQSAEASQSIRT
jgi:uncharacterized protein (TIGR02284 family)